MPASSCEVQVRYNETGPQGIVYHANYCAWFELAQHEFLLRHGYSFDDFAKRNVILAMTDIKTKFLAPARFGDRLRVDMDIVDVNKVRILVDFKVFRISDGAAVAESTATYVCVDRDFKPLLLSRAIPELYQTLREEYERNK